MADVCTEHSGVCVNIENLKKDTEANSKEIRTLSDAVVKLTVLVESVMNSPTPVKQVFWDSDTKKYAIRAGFILLVVLILALIGTNIIENVDLAKLIK